MAVRLNDLLLPIVKGYGSEKAYELLATSLQVFGGSGFTQDYPVEQYIRDSKIDTLYEGTTTIQGMDLFFRKIVRDQGQALGRLTAEIQEFSKGDAGNGALARERELLGQALDDVQAHRRPLRAGPHGLGRASRGASTRSGLEHHPPAHASATSSSAGCCCARPPSRSRRCRPPSARDRAFYEGKVAAAQLVRGEGVPRARRPRGRRRGDRPVAHAARRGRLLDRSTRSA